MLKATIRLLGLGALLVMAATASAQGGLTPEQNALLERVLAVEKILPTYSSYVEETLEITHMDMTLRSPGATMSFTSDTTREAESTVSRQDGKPNVHAFITAEVSETGPDGVSVYTMQAEVRVVNSVMYVLVTATPAEGSVLPDAVATLPPDWFVVGDPADFPELDPLSLDGVVPDDGQSDETDPFSSMETLAKANPEVTLEQVKWGSGTADEITIVIDAEGLFSIDIMSEMGLPVESLEQARDLLNDDSQVSYAVTLDPVGNPLRAAMTMFMAVTGVDATLEDNSLPPGTTYDLAMNMQMVTKLGHVNEPVQPVSAP